MVSFDLLTTFPLRESTLLNKYSTCFFWLRFGFNHISLTNSHWLSAHDMTADLISWKYYSNDIWRFPIGNNPNYGMDIASGIVFSGSIPLLAAIFNFWIVVVPIPLEGYIDNQDQL